MKILYLQFYKKMNRHERTELFMSLYLTEVEKAPDAKRYTCYIRAEAAIENRTGKRQYVKYETFKASMSRRKKIKRINCKKIKTMKNIVNPVNRSPMGICMQYQKPRQFAALAAHRIKYKYAEELAAEIVPKMGERYYCIVNGTFIFGDFIEAIVVQNNWLVKNMSISTLGYNQNNVDSFVNLIEGDYVRKLSIIASCEFYGFESSRTPKMDGYKLVPYTYEKLNTGKIDFQLSFADTHMKIINIETECGIFVSIHGSANLRSSGNIEQFSVDFDRNIYDINQEVFDKILEQTKTIKKPVRGKALWSIIE